MPAGEDTRPAEGVAAEGHPDIAIDAAGYVLTHEPGEHVTGRPLGKHELWVMHTECGQRVTRIGPGDDEAMILDEITNHDVACSYSRAGDILAEPMAAGFIPHKVGRCWCQSAHDTDETIRLNRELTDALGLDRAGRVLPDPGPVVADPGPVVVADQTGQHRVRAMYGGRHTAWPVDRPVTVAEIMAEFADLGPAPTEAGGQPESYGPGVVLLAARTATHGAALNLAGRVRGKRGDALAAEVSGWLREHDVDPDTAESTWPPGSAG